MFLFKAECQPILSLRNVQVLLTQRTKPLPDGIGRRQCHRRVAPQHYPELFDSGPPLQPIILFSPGFFQGRSWHQRLLLSRVNAVRYASSASLQIPCSCSWSTVSCSIPLAMMISPSVVYPPPGPCGRTAIAARHSLSASSNFPSSSSTL